MKHGMTGRNIDRFAIFEREDIGRSEIYASLARTASCRINRNGENRNSCVNSCVSYCGLKKNRSNNQRSQFSVRFSENVKHGLHLGKWWRLFETPLWDPLLVCFCVRLWVKHDTRLHHVESKSRFSLCAKSPDWPDCLSSLLGALWNEWNINKLCEINRVQIKL